MTVATGPCGWVLDPSTCSTDWASFSAAVQAKATNFATYVLWASTGRRYGLCQNIIRPCGADRRCGSCGSWDFFGTWMRPVILNGFWRNCLCDCACSCRPNCQIRLPGPVSSITTVLQDGVAVPSTSWRVDDYQWLVRTDGICWPDCQDFNLNVPAVGTLEVTYLRGEAVPAVLLDAAGTVAVEFAKSCVGSACRLPGRIQTLSRNGVVVNFVDVDRLLSQGLTGLQEVDQVIVAMNPGGLRQRPRVWAPEINPRLRVVT